MFSKKNIFAFRFKKILAFFCFLTVLGSSNKININRKIRATSKSSQDSQYLDNSRKFYKTNNGIGIVFQTEKDLNYHNKDLLEFINNNVAQIIIIEALKKDIENKMNIDIDSKNFKPSMNFFHDPSWTAPNFWRYLIASHYITLNEEEYKKVYKQSYWVRYEEWHNRVYKDRSPDFIYKKFEHNSERKFRREFKYDKKFYSEGLEDLKKLSYRDFLYELSDLRRTQYYLRPTFKVEPNYLALMDLDNIALIYKKSYDNKKNYCVYKEQLNEYEQNNVDLETLEKELKDNKTKSEAKNFKLAFDIVDIKEKRDEIKKDLEPKFRSFFKRKLENDITGMPTGVKNFFECYLKKYSIDMETREKLRTIEKSYREFTKNFHEFSKKITDAAKVHLHEENYIKNLINLAITRIIESMIEFFEKNYKKSGTNEIELKLISVKDFLKNFEMNISNPSYIPDISSDLLNNLNSIENEIFKMEIEPCKKDKVETYLDIYIFEKMKYDICPMSKIIETLLTYKKFLNDKKSITALMKISDFIENIVITGLDLYNTEFTSDNLATIVHY